MLNKINGSENIDELNDSMKALSKFYKAFNERDIHLMESVWDNNDKSVMDNPVGGIKIGWNDIKDVYTRIFTSNAKVYVEFYDFIIQESDGFFYITGKEKGTFQKGNTNLDLRIRTSRIFRKINEKWVQIHHHGSIDDPELLKTYQEAVSAS